MYVQFFFPEIVSYAQLGPVVYKDKEVIVSNPTDFPDVGDMGIRVKEIQEPVVKASIIVPEGFCSPLPAAEHATYLRDFRQNFSAI